MVSLGMMMGVLKRNAVAYDLFFDDDSEPAKKYRGSVPGRVFKVEEEGWEVSSWAKYLPVDITGRSRPHPCWNPSSPQAKLFVRRFRVTPDAWALLTDIAHQRLGFPLIPKDAFKR